jgi:uncharacterized protein YigE (DUF2233 family)
MNAFARISSWLMAAMSISLASHAGEASRVEFEGITYRVYRAQPGEIELHWKDSSGQPYAQISRLQAEIEAKGRNIEFVMNAGIFESGGIPSGLHLEKGVELLPLNLREGVGNFFLKPNGVFAVADGKGVIMESGGFGKSAIKATLGIQSGPLLLQGGAIHPQFQKNSPNQKHRNGVGIVAATGQVVFAITELQPLSNRVNLHGFARLFQSLGCKDALFLDGDISEMVVKSAGPIAPGNRLGAFLVVTSAAKK